MSEVDCKAPVSIASPLDVLVTVIFPPLAFKLPTETFPVPVSRLLTVIPPLFEVTEFRVIPPSPVFVTVISPLWAEPIPLSICVPSVWITPFSEERVISPAAVILSWIFRVFSV